MADVKVNQKILRDLLRSPEVLADLERRAEAIAHAADAAANDPGGHKVDSQTGRKRARASVRTGTPKSMWKEAVHRTLTGALDAGRR